MPQTIPDVGNMVADGRSFIVTAWWICFFPGSLTLVVYSFNTSATAGAGST